eukprot:EG_transcript_18811
MLRVARTLCAGPQLYGGHRPTDLVQKLLLTVGSAGAALYNPLRGDMVATLGETTGACALEGMRARMRADPVGQRILAERPSITSDKLQVETLLQLPAGTLGRAYAEYMAAHRFVADERSTVHFVDDPELAYVMKRYREVHDMLHGVTGFPPTELGELGLKAYEYVQTGLPMCALSVTFGSIRLSLAEKRHLLACYLPWAAAGVSTPFYMNVYFEEELHTDVTELRQQLGLPPVPLYEG